MAALASASQNPPPAGDARCTSAACRSGCPGRGCVPPPSGGPPGLGLAPHGGALADHAARSQHLPAGPVVIAGVQMHDRLGGSHTHHDQGIQVAASSPSSRRLAAAATPPAGCLAPRSPWSAKPLLAAVDRAGPAGLAAAGCLGDAAVHRQVVQFQPEQPIVGVNYRTSEPVDNADDDPLVTAAAQRGRRAGVIGDPAVVAAEHQDLDELVEDDPIGDAAAVAAERMVNRAVPGLTMAGQA
jgi:hypothetical protein